MKLNIYKPKKIIIFFILLILNGKFYKKYNNPKISIFLPIYNKSNYLKKSIKSIQMQTLQNIEIIVVNDCSEDGSLDILMNMAKNDLRIKIINNDKNRGLLYSRAMGILNSKGEYLMNLDPDDEFKGSDNLEYLYKMAKKSKIDFISFGFIKKNKSNTTKYILCSNYKNIYYQPEIINNYYKHFDYLIWNKLVKKKVLLKVYEIFKEKINGEKWNYSEDEIWSALIYKYSDSMICVDKTIYIYNINHDSLMRNKYSVLYLKNIIDWIEMFEIILNNENGKPLLINRFKELLKRINLNKTYYLNIIYNNKDIKNKYIKIFKRIKKHFLFNITF